MRRISTGSALRFRGRKSHGLRGLQGKPFHPPLTDLPVAAYVIAPILDVVAFFGGEATWASRLHYAAGYVFLVGAAFSLLTVATGFADWLSSERGSKVRAMANAHALSMVVVTLLVLANLGVRFLAGDGGRTTGAMLTLSVLIALAVTFGAMIGGALVYDYGFNVRTAADDPAYHAEAYHAERLPARQRLRRTG